MCTWEGYNTESLKNIKLKGEKAEAVRNDLGNRMAKNNTQIYLKYLLEFVPGRRVESPLGKEKLSQRNN